MGRTGAGLFLAILVVAALGAGYLAVNVGRQASNTSTSTSQVASSSTSSIEEPTSTTAKRESNAIVTSAAFP